MDGERDELVDRQTDVWLVGKLADWLIDLPPVDCQNAKASESQDDENEGPSPETNLTETGFEKV